MKITFVLPLYSDHPSGGFKVVYDYSNHFVRRGHQVNIIYLAWPFRGSSAKRSQLAQFRWLIRQLPSVYLKKKPRISWMHLQNEINLMKVSDLQERHLPNADAIFATAWQTASCVNEYSREKGAKFYLVQDFPPWLGDKYELEQTWRLPLKKVAVSSWLAHTILQAGMPKADIACIPIAVDHDRFRVTRQILDRPKRVIMLFHPSARKRSRMGLSALLKCKEVVAGLEVSLFGPLKRRPAGLPHWIEYYGNVSETQLVELYNRASICLCSSAAEGFALPPAEAMACGCAVVTTDCGGNRDYAEHEKTALVSDPDDFASLVSNTLRLLSDEELRVKIALAGRERMLDFTWEKSSRQLAEFIRYNL